MDVTLASLVPCPHFTSSLEETKLQRLLLRMLPVKLGTPLSSIYLVSPAM
jgi:hypothetical protein